MKRSATPYLAVSCLLLSACGESPGSLFEQSQEDASSLPPEDAATDPIPDAATCQNECSAGEVRCQAGTRQRCVVSSACAQWSADPCPSSTPYCSEGACASQCVSQCQPAERVCESPGWKQCEQVNGCWVFSAVVACGTQELCSADAQCIPSCDGQPCPCTDGQTQPCSDIGACVGGSRLCEGGHFGACQWTVGPSAETCNGVDDDCNGVSDDGLVAPACALQAGVCAGAVRTCGGLQGWNPCSAATYASHAAASGQTYQSTESLCDGLDNDCNGQTDEATGCCPSSCAGKVCGADDGCGHACQTGTCPANQQCQQGQCACAHSSCGTDCCGVAQVCAASGCCLPSCGSRVCGPDPVCGSSCGACPQGNCTSEGQCYTGPTWQNEVSPVTADLYGVWGTSRNNVWAVGNSGVIVHYDGTAWSTIPTPTSAALMSVWGMSASDAWTVGTGGTILHYNGSTWSAVASPITTGLHAVWGYHSAAAYAVGDQGRVVFWNGTSWESCCYYTSNSLVDIWGRSGTDFLFGGYEKLYRVTQSATYVHSFAWDTVRAIAGNATDTWIVVETTTETYFEKLTGDYFSSAHTDQFWYADMVVTTSGELWAVGDYIAHFDGADWEHENAPASLHGIWWDSGSGELFAVGQGGVIVHYH